MNQIYSTVSPKDQQAQLVLNTELQSSVLLDGLTPDFQNKTTVLFIRAGLQKTTSRETVCMWCECRCTGLQQRTAGLGFFSVFAPVALLFVFWGLGFENL